MDDFHASMHQPNDNVAESVSRLTEPTVVLDNEDTEPFGRWGIWGE
ncbi:MAG: hypothetical protein MPN21_19975 [Thermoanaerobaculia bacterium]|nr:hypothetical protein [Thermoanaerobaculia bacterium]